MKVIYSARAIRDLERIVAYYTAVAHPNIAGAVGARVEHVINRIARNPFSHETPGRANGGRSSLSL
jgi:plasmid stabilization system protein ParE